MYDVICNLATKSVKQDLRLLSFILKTKQNKQKFRLLREVGGKNRHGGPGAKPPENFLGHAL